MKTALALRHIHFEDLGTLAPLLRARGFEVRYLDPAVDELSAIDAGSADLVVALGGPLGAFDEDLYPFLAAELHPDWVAVDRDGRALIRRPLSADSPLRGQVGWSTMDLASEYGQYVRSQVTELCRAYPVDGFWFDILQSGNFRQYNISAAQALEDFNNGAYIVDVRSYEDYSQLHIKGSIHIPLDELEAELEKIAPDRSSKIIFYCAKGVKSQKALEKALLMGYEKVYNLGSIDDWPYDTETGGISNGR